jgi:hypothetical protein
MEPEYRPLIPPKHKGATRPNRMVGSYERKKVERGLLTPDVITPSDGDLRLTLNDYPILHQTYP